MPGVICRPYGCIIIQIIYKYTIYMYILHILFIYRLITNIEITYIQYRSGTDDMAAAAATTAQAFRKLVRNGKYTTHTCGLGELGRYAQRAQSYCWQRSKRLSSICELNPKPCPLLEMTEVGTIFRSNGEGTDLRSDLPSYRIFKHGKPVEETDNVKAITIREIMT